MDNRLRRKVDLPRGQNDLLFAGGEQAARIHNFVLTPVDTLRTIVGPCEYVHTRITLPGEQGPLEPAGGRYGSIRGIHHALLEGGRRDALLIHARVGADNFVGVWTHAGWRMSTLAGPGGTGWQLVLGPEATAQPGNPIVGSLRNDETRASEFLTQFVSTPTGVVIIPQDGRAHFYDGDVCLPLGYEIPPGSPTPMAQLPSSIEGDDDNVDGYIKNGRTVQDLYGTFRLGTVRSDAVPLEGSNKANSLGGILEVGSWRAATQYVDYFGNLSPIGPMSSPFVCRKEDNLTKERKKAGDESVERLRFQGVWLDIDPGPEGTVGRILLRTKDQLNSGVPGLFEVPSDAVGTTTAFATIPDNETQTFPDNVPDAWLVTPAVDVVPVPRFRVAAQAFGRLWIGNWPGSNGMVRYSRPGQWGTFERLATIVPDPRGWEVTGFLLTDKGLLIFTEVSTHLVAPNDEGAGFRAVTLSNTIGCVSPNTAQVMPGGAPIWMGREGWYTLEGGEPALISQPIQESVFDRITRSYWRHACATVCPRSREYRCWVPIDGSRRTLCVVFDGELWRTRDDVDARAVCTTQDHRGYVLALGYAIIQSTSGGAQMQEVSVWVLDHEDRGPGVSVRQNTAVMETVWLRSVESFTEAQQLSTLLWVRETSSKAAPKVEFFRDWRIHPNVHEVADNPVNLLTPQDPPLLWGEAVVDGEYFPEARPNDKEKIPTHWTRRRPYWIRVDTHNPTSVFKTRITVTGDLDFIGYSSEEVVVPGSGVRPGSRTRG